MQCFLCHGHELEYRRDDIGCEVTGCLTCGNEFYTKGQTIRHDARKEYRAAVASGHETIGVW